MLQKLEPTGSPVGAPKRWYGTTFDTASSNFCKILGTNGFSRWSTTFFSSPTAKAIGLLLPGCVPGPLPEVPLLMQVNQRHGKYHKEKTARNDDYVLR